MLQLTQLLLIMAVALATAILVGKPGAWKKVGVIALLFYPALLAGNLLALWETHGKVADMLVNAGWPTDPYLFKAISALLALLLYGGIPYAVSAFMKSKQWDFVAYAALLYCGLNLFLFAVSRPGPGQLANPKTGASLFEYYRDTERNCVEQFPAGTAFHPSRIGVKLLPADDQVVQEWKKNPCKQQPQVQETGSPAKPPAATGPAAVHELWLGKVQLKFESCKNARLPLELNTVCTITVKNTSEEDYQVIFRAQGIAILDVQGKRHDPSKVSIDGDWGFQKVFNWRNWGYEKEYCWECDYSRILLAREQVNFQVAFRKTLDHDLDYLRTFVRYKGGLFWRSQWLEFTKLPVINEAVKRTSEQQVQEHVGWHERLRRVVKLRPLQEPTISPETVTQVPVRTIEVSPSPEQSVVYPVGNGVSKPELLYKIKPVYTDVAKQARLMGTVQIEFIVGQDGLARNMKLTKSLGMGLDEQALAALGKWKFRPARLAGEPVSVKAQVDIVFSLF